MPNFWNLLKNFELNFLLSLKFVFDVLVEITLNYFCGRVVVPFLVEIRLFTFFTAISFKKFKLPNFV